jgi:amidase
MADYAAPFPELNEASIADLQGQMSAGQLTARRLVEMYLARIEALDRGGPTLRSIIETNPDALELADRLDRERAAKHMRGPLHGVPLLLKDNIDTADRMGTTAGSLALVGARPARDATVAEKLRAAGAIVLGKCNLSEWANFRSTHSSSGWSARGGQALNPYSLDRSPCGSSSGSASAVSASLAAASLGTETDGSILCPAAANGVVGIKPTLGLTSRAGVVPIAHSQDTVGPMGRTVADAALLLGAIAGADSRDPVTQAPPGRQLTDYTRFLDEGALRGARIGVAREVYFGYSQKADQIAETAIDTLKGLGAVVVDPANIPTAKQMREGDSELSVLLYEFKADLNAYLAALQDSPVRTLADVIAFNQAHAEQEMPYFAQELFVMAEAKGPLTDPEYQQALAQNRRLAREEGIDAVMDAHQLDALVMPTGAPAWKIDLIAGDHHSGGSSQPSALAGYPAITVPAGDVFGLPIGLTFMGRAFSEPKLIALAYAFEQATKARRTPTYRTSTP